jgi:hypothetical protein
MLFRRRPRQRAVIKRTGNTAVISAMGQIGTTLCMYQPSSRISIPRRATHRPMLFRGTPGFVKPRLAAELARGFHRAGSARKIQEY